MGKIYGIPFVNSTINLRYEYTDAMYLEDVRIAHWCVYTKYANNLPEKSITKEDLVQCCVMRLWQKRPTYDPSKSKYLTWATLICRSVIFYNPIVKRQVEDVERFDLDYVISTDANEDNLTLLDLLGEPDIESTADLRQMIYKAVYCIHAPTSRVKAKELVDLFFNGEVNNLAQAGAIMGYTRERMRQLIKKVRIHALRILNDNNDCCVETNINKKCKPIKIDLSQLTFKQLYKAKGFTQKTLAQEIGVGVENISRWLRGCYFPRPDNIEKLAKIFDCSYEQMQAIILRKN